MTILALLVGILVQVLRPSVFEGKRLSGPQFVVAVVVSFVLWCGAWSWFCEKWAAVAVPRWGDWLPPFLIDFFYSWELVLAPFVDGAVLYSAILFYLKLANFPEGMTRAEVHEWRLGLKRKYLIGIVVFETLLLIYYACSRGVPFLIERLG